MYGIDLQSTQYKYYCYRITEYVSSKMPIILAIISK